MEFIRNINVDVYNISAIAVGYILIDGSTPAIQNSLGNWFMLVGQILCTNAAQQQVLNRNNNTNNADTNAIINSDDQIVMMQRVIDALKQEIDNLKS